MTKKSPNKKKELPSKLIQHIKLVMHKEEFSKRVIKVRKKIGVPVDGFVDDLHMNKEFSKINKSLIRGEIEKMRLKFNLTPFYRDILKYYIYYNTIEGHKGLSGNVQVLLRDNRLNDSQDVDFQLFIEITPDTTIEDIRQVWDGIEMHQAHLLGYDNTKSRFRKIINLDRDLMIVELFRSGVPIKEISTKINKIYKNNKIYGPDDIKRRLKKMEKRIKEA